MTELQNDRKDKNNMPPDLQSRGHKNVFSCKLNRTEPYFCYESIGNKII